MRGLQDVKHVIDTGRVKESSYNTETRMSNLVTSWTSQASCLQRAGRAGRTAKGICWRLYSKAFFERVLPIDTPPEIFRSALDSCILQICLMYENRRHQRPLSQDSVIEGVRPGRFLSHTPEAPSDARVLEACAHLIEIGAIRVVETSSSNDTMMSCRLTPLGYHLSKMPVVDAKVGKVLLLGCILGVLDNALIIAANLSCTKGIFLPSRRKETIDARKEMIETGFGSMGRRVSKSDSFASITVFNRWDSLKGDERDNLTRELALNSGALREIRNLRTQLMSKLSDAGIICMDNESEMLWYNRYKESAPLTSCCLVVGLHPNLSSLVRPGQGVGGQRGKLMTSDGFLCVPSSSSFQRDRVNDVSSSGRDAYVVFHSRHRVESSNNSCTNTSTTYLTELTFVSRFAVLLFGGKSLHLSGGLVGTSRYNECVLDGWLKFRVDCLNKQRRGLAVLVLEFRRKLHAMIGNFLNDKNDEEILSTKTDELLRIVDKLLTSEEKE